MSYPYTNQSIDKANMSPDATVARLIIINDATRFTPRDIIKFFEEGFLPAFVDIDGGDLYAPDIEVSIRFCEFSNSNNSYLFDNTQDSYSSPDLDTKFTKQ